MCALEKLDDIQPLNEEISHHCRHFWSSLDSSKAGLMPDGGPYNCIKQLELRCFINL